MSAPSPDEGTASPGSAARDPVPSGATRTAAGASRRAALDAFAAEGCSAPRAWGNGPGDRYGAHDHPFHKVLFCLDGSIVFHLEGRDLALAAGDRLDLPPGTVHAATVGPEGCECVEAAR